MTQTALTREQVLALKPGNNLDLIVAIEVMGHEAGEFKDGWIKLGPKFEGCPKRYSTDMTAAWEVIKTVQKEWAWEMKMHNTACEVDVYIGRKAYTSKNVSEAICKAALLAVLDL